MGVGLMQRMNLCGSPIHPRQRRVVGRVPALDAQALKSHALEHHVLSAAPKELVGRERLLIDSFKLAVLDLEQPSPFSEQLFFGHSPSLFRSNAASMSCKLTLGLRGSARARAGLRCSLAFGHVAKCEV